ncbi:MAG: hypothetical protein JHC33_06340 [Ignisphaera sp.]|nr:hypothetical protein [Ignisphaera sp.]
MLFTDSYRYADVKSRFLLATLIILIIVLTHLRPVLAQPNDLIVGNNSITWRFSGLGSSIPTNPFQFIFLSYSPSYVHTLFIIKSSNVTALLNMNTQLYFVGRERVYYIINTSIASGKIFLSERVEGNIAVDSRDIVMQWQKYNVSIIGGASEINATPVAITIWLGKHLKEMLKDPAFNIGGAVKSADGVLMLKADKGAFSAVIDLIDVYIDRSRYGTALLQNVRGCEVLDFMPMKSSVRINVRILGDVVYTELYVDGIDATEVLNAYRAFLCLLPSLAITYNISINAVHNISSIMLPFLPFEHVLYIVIPKLVTPLIVSTLLGYSRIYQQVNVSKNALIYALLNATTPEPGIAIRIENTNATLTDLESARRLTCFIANNTVGLFIPSATLCSAINEARIYSIETVTTPKQQEQENKSNILIILLAVIVAVAINTAIVIYMMIKVLKYRRRS